MKLVSYNINFLIKKMLTYGIFEPRSLGKKFLLKCGDEKLEKYFIYAEYLLKQTFYYVM